MRMGATHFLMKRLPKVASEMALHVLAYNLTRWPAPGSEDTELRCSTEQEADHGEAEIYAGVQA